MEKYLFILIPLIVNVISQIIKYIIELISKKKTSIKRLFDGAGGFPSSHTALVTSLCTVIGIKLGYDSPYFAIATIFSLIVIYDALHLRHEVGLHAKHLNKHFKEKDFKEDVGHTLPQVIGGLVLGIVLTYILTNIF
ncbi:MAG: divergent PAP2 family protein [bacterium]|nr:divergent PAP2 family protein [bacterium]